jgi:hypothetical protein
MKALYNIHKEGWWVKVSPLARKEPECWAASVYKKGKFSWITEECSEFICPEDAYTWGWNRVYVLSDKKVIAHAD